MICDQAFWQYSIALYQKPGVEQACLHWQDSYQLNINLLLLAAYLQKQGLAIGDIGQLLRDTEQWRTSYLLPMRDMRKQAKAINSALYQQTKSLELEAEKVEQKLLLKHLLKQSLVGDTEDGMNRVWQFFNVPPSEQQQNFIQQFNTA